jgi:hypothetical protein
MLIRMPPNPPEEWQTILAALETRAKTLRLCLILLVRNLLVALVIIAAIIWTLTMH